MWSFLRQSVHHAEVGFIRYSWKSFCPTSQIREWSYSEASITAKQFRTASSVSWKDLGHGYTGVSKPHIFDLVGCILTPMTVLWFLLPQMLFLLLISQNKLPFSYCFETDLILNIAWLKSFICPRKCSSNSFCDWLFHKSVKTTQ